MLSEGQSVKEGEEATPRGSSATLEQEKTKNEMFFVLSNHRRRFVLDYLYREAGPCEVRDLVEALAAWENDLEPSKTTSVQRKRAYVSLRQSHLPKLADLDFIEYEASRGVVETGDRWELTEAYLEHIGSGGGYSRAVVTSLIGLAVLGLGIGILVVIVL